MCFGGGDVIANTSNFIFILSNPISRDRKYKLRNKESFSLDGSKRPLQGHIFGNSFGMLGHKDGDCLPMTLLVCLLHLLKAKNAPNKNLKKIRPTVGRVKDDSKINFLAYCRQK